MPRYIDADKLCEGRVSNDPVVIAAKCEPTADVQEVKHGKLEKHAVDVVEHPFHCSICGWSNYHIHQKYILDFDYCPKCGAKMDGKK